MSESSSDLDRGVAALARGELFVARAALSRAVAHAPFDVVARHDLAVVERLRGELSTAWTHADAAVEFCAPDARAFPVVCSHRALLDRLMGEASLADQGLVAGLRSDPSHRVSLAYQGLFARLDGTLDVAVDRWREALRDGPRPRLPALVRARLEGMIADAIALGVSKIEPAERCASAIGAITELLLPEGDPSLVDAAPVTDSLTAFASDAASAAECSIDEAATIVSRARRIVVLTGAGCSAESGLATRKDLWKRFDKDDAVSITHGSLAMLWRVIEDFLGDDEAQPNPAHDVIASLPRVAAIITQNVDDLHQRAARDDMDPVPIIELHGTLERTLCHDCGASRGARARELLRDPTPPRCLQCGRPTVRPDVVLFGEWVSRAALDESVRQVSACDLLLIVGCAMDVAPASELPRIARAHGATVIEVKRGASRLSKSLDTKLLRGSAATVLPVLYGAVAEREDVLALSGRPLRAPRASEAGSGRLVDVMLPALNESAVSATISRWLRLPGARVQANDVLCEAELDKATIELPSPVAGTLHSVLVREGEDAEIATVIARVEVAGDRAADGAPPSAPFRWPAARSRRVRDPLAAPKGPHEDAVRAMLQQVCVAPLLEPDLALARLDDLASRDVAAMANELAACFGLEDELRVELFRDPLEASNAEVERWRAARASRALAPLAQRWAEFAAQKPFSSDQAVLRAAAAASKVATDRAAPRLRGFATMPIAAFTRVVHGAVASAASSGPDAPCRWRPLLTLWLRGAWPFALPDSLGVWVPQHEGGLLVAPLPAFSLTDEARTPLRAAARGRTLAEGLWPRSPAEWYRVD